MHKLTKIFLVTINIFVILIEAYQLIFGECEHPAYEIFKILIAGISAIVFAHAEIDEGNDPRKGDFYAN